MSNDQARTIRVYVCTPIKKIISRLETIQDKIGLSKGLQVYYILWDVTDKSRDSQWLAETKTDSRCFRLKSFSNSQALSFSSRTFPRRGSPFGPGGTFRQGLLAYSTARMMAMMAKVRTKPTRGVRNCRTEVNWGQLMRCDVAQSIEPVDMLS